MSAPLLSLVVPHKAGDLRFLARSLKAQTLEAAKFELILVSEAGDEVDPSLWAGCGFAISLLRYERPIGFIGHSAGSMRNIGIRQADADRIVFVDADCMLGPACLARHAAAIEAPAPLALAGLARELPAKLPRSRLESLGHDELWVLSARDGREEGREEPGSGPAPEGWLDFYSCNASAPRDLIIKAGLFDESGYRCHDLDLGYRLHKAGLRFRIDPACEVIHLEHPRSVWFRQEQIKGWLWLAERHPELRPLVEDKVVVVKRSQWRTLDRAEARFARLTGGLPGIRCGTTWLLPDDMAPGVLARALAGLPFTRRERAGSTEYFLRLDKHCWDFSLLAPTPSAEPLVSVVIAAYQAEASIARAVESVLRQTDQSFELIVVDDGSTDGTAARLLPYYASRRLRVIANHENRGLSHCLNRALALCRGRYLLQLDADDWLETDALARLIDAFERNPEASALYGAPRVHELGAGEGREPRIEAGFQISTAFDCLAYPYYQAPRIYRVAALKAAGGWRIDDAYEGRYFEDRLMLARLAEAGAVHFLPEPVYNVLTRRQSLSRRKPYRAASAKLAILYGEAGRRGETLCYAFEGRLLSAKAFAAPENKSAKRWSVIIPFRGAVEPLLLTLRSWLQSGIADRELEILVVVDGSDNAGDLGRLPQSEAIRIIERAEQGGPAAARNSGVAAARHDWLFFCDADRIVPPNVLAMHEARHETAEGMSLVVGDVFGRRCFAQVPQDLSTARKRRFLEQLRFRPELRAIAEGLLRGESRCLIAPDCPAIWPAAQAYAFTESWQRRWGELLLQHGEALQRYPHRWLRVGSGSLSLARKTFEALGGFDEAFHAMEDWEFGARAQKAGCAILAAPEAEPLHQMHPIHEGRLAAEAAGRARLAAKHPDLIEQLRFAGNDAIPPGGEQFIAADSAHSRRRTAAWEAQAAEVPGGDLLLTFDDGPHGHYSNLVLDALEVLDAPAVFFVLGSRLRRQAETLRRIARAGHEIGLHGWHHLSWAELTRDDIEEELRRSLRLVEDIAGKRPRCFRPPYGVLPLHAAEAGASLGLTPVGWDVSSRDWLGLPETDIAIELAAHRLGGKVLLFHDGYGDPAGTATALRWLLPACRSAGIEPAELESFLGRHPAPPLRSPPANRIG